MRQEGWQGLADALIGQTGPVPRNTADALARIEANRAKNYEMAAKLAKELDRILDRLAAGTLRIKKRFQYKGQVVECDAEPSIADFVQLATYMRMVHDMTYRALGDIVANGGHKADAAAGAQPPSLPIEIILPKEIALPRHERAARAEAERKRLLEQENGETPSLNN
jgi:hypothetical protein